MEYYFNKGRYIVPLDAVDESLMCFDRSIPKKMDDYKPIWSMDVLNLRNEKCYYQIDVHKGLSESEARCDDDYINELKTDTCFICNVEVPEHFTKAHIDSYKHQMYLSIANAAIERINKNLNQKCYTTDTKGLLYFCETCVTVVPVADKPFHLQSDIHKKTLEGDKNLKKFMDLYVNDDAQLNNNDILNSIEKIESNSSLNQSDLSVANLSDNWINIFDKKYRTESLLTKEAEKKLLDYYGIDEVDIKPTHLVICVDKNHHMIQLEGECRLKVNLDNYHGIDKLMKQRYQCKLCSETFKRKQKHIASEKHIRRISLAIKDQHCIRELDSTQSHCILCNELFYIGDPHIYSEVHKEQLQMAILNPNEHVGNCEVAEEVLPDVDDTVKDNWDDNTSSSSMLQSDNGTSDPFCELCQRFIMEENEINHVCERRREIMPEKLRGEDHTEASEAKLEDIEISKDLVTTQPVVAQNQSLQGNFKKKIKRKVLKNVEDIDSYGNQNLCVNLIPKQTTQATENAVRIETDLSTKRNKIKNNKVSVKSEPENVKLCSNNTETDNSLLLEEKECIPNEATTQADANTEVNEKAEPPFTEDVSQCNKVNGKMTETKKRHNTLKKRDKFVLHTSSNEKELVCIICKAIVPNNKRSVKEHLSGLKHNNNASQRLDDNQMKKTDDMFFCKVCDDHVIFGNQFSHIESKVHKKKLDRFRLEQSKNRGSKKNRSPVEKDDPANDLKNNDEKNMTNSTRKGTMDVSSCLPNKYKINSGNNLDGLAKLAEDEFICYFCQVLLPSDEASLSEHTKTLKHIQEKSSFLRKHEIDEMNKGFRCYLCVEDMKPNMLFKHVQKQFHIKMLESWLLFMNGEDVPSIGDSNFLERLKLSMCNFKKNNLLTNRVSFVAEDWVRKCNATVCHEGLTDCIRKRMKMNIIKKKRRIVVKSCRY